MNNKKLELLRRELASLPEGTLHVKHGRKYTSFVEYKSRKEVKNINQDMDRVHLLARKKYITSLLKSADTSQLLKDYLEAGLDISRITLTPSQYKWMHTPFKSHPSRADDLKYSTLSGIRVRSLSERDIGNMYETLGIP